MPKFHQIPGCKFNVGTTYYVFKVFAVTVYVMAR